MAVFTVLFALTGCSWFSGSEMDTISVSEAAKLPASTQPEDYVIGAGDGLSVRPRGLRVI